MRLDGLVTLFRRDRFAAAKGIRLLRDINQACLDRIARILIGAPGIMARHMNAIAPDNHAAAKRRGN